MRQFSSLNSSNEIDLITLLSVLWKNKIRILLVSFIFTILAAVYAFTAKEQWTSKAVVIAPKVADMTTYLSLRSEYADILNIKDFNQQSVLNDLFDNFKTHLFSNNLKREFLDQSTWFEQYIESQSASEEQKQKYIVEILEKTLLITIPDLKKNPNSLGVNISFSAETPMEAKKVLEDYISFVNKFVLLKDKTDFLTDINLTLNSLELQKDKIQIDTKNTRQVQLENLNNALDIAKLAGIREYSKVVNNINIPQISLGDAQIPFTDSKLSDGTYLFMLGEKYLQAQVDIFSKNQIVYPVAFYTIEKQISMLKNLAEKVVSESSDSSYYYLSSPDYPVKRDWPKRAIILIIAIILGGVIGSLLVLIKLLFNQK